MERPVVESMQKCLLVTMMQEITPGGLCVCVGGGGGAPICVTLKANYSTYYRNI